MSWVPFYSSLREGDKRGIPRATRFIFLELSLVTRPTAGRLALPRGFKSDVEAVHDILGGDRREIRSALELLTVPLDPTDPEDEPLIALSGPPERRVLTVSRHEKWVRPDTTAERVRRHRTKRLEESRALASPGNDGRNVTETASRGEESRGEESRGEVPRTPSVLPSSPIPLTAEAQSQPKTRSKVGPTRGTRIDPNWQPSPEVLERFRTRERVDASRCIERFKNHWQTTTGKNAVKIDWDLTFVNWVLGDIERGKAVPWSPPASATQLALTSRTPRVDVVDGPFVPAPPEALAAMAKLGLRPKGDLTAEVLETVEHADVRFRKAGG